MSSQLTRRQMQFLSQFLDFYQRMEEPVHYSALAQHLGLGRITAYEMLRLLENRGLVRAEYHLPPASDRGPGRSEVFFLPTERAHRLLGVRADETQNNEKWEAAKAKILKEISEGKTGRYESLIEDLLMRIPEQHSPMVFMTEMIAAIILSLSTIESTALGKKLIDQLKKVGIAGEIGLITLAGISTVLSAILDANIKFTSIFLKYSRKYQENLLKLSSEKQKQLSDFANEVANIVIG